MDTWKLTVASVCLTLAAYAADRPAAKPFSEHAAARCAAPATTAAIAEIAPCSECPRECASHVNACKDGSVKECYLAAACLCQCNLDAGGCGSDKEALRQCVEDNKKNARDLEP